MKLTKTIARKVLATVDAGLCQGKGQPVPGEMCVEAAVCFAMGLLHGDEPPCVGEAVRSYKVALNDCYWSSNAARAQGMRKLAIAQLGSNEISQEKFTELVRIKGIQRSLPVILRSWAKHPKCKNAAKILKAARECESAKTLGGAEAAAKTASDYASDYDSDYAYAYASASDYAYAYASASAPAYAYASAPAYAYAYASASAYAEYLTKELGEDFLLKLSAEIALEALVELKSPGCKWLDLCET